MTSGQMVHKLSTRFEFSIVTKLAEELGILFVTDPHARPSPSHASARAQPHNSLTLHSILCLWDSKLRAERCKLVNISNH